MGGNEDKLLSGSINKAISIFYNDTLNTVSLKVGKLLDFDSFNLEILEDSKNVPTLIPRSKCVRIELRGERNVANTRTR